MTQVERMVKGLIYDACDPEIQAMQRPLQDRLWELNQLRPSDAQAKEADMKKVFAECGDYCNIKLPIAHQCNDEECAFFRSLVVNP